MEKNPIVEIIRAVARPAVTIINAAVMAQAVIEGIDLPGWYLAMAIPTIAWWFGERFYQHRKEK